MHQVIKEGYRCFRYSTLDFLGDKKMNELSLFESCNNQCFYYELSSVINFNAYCNFNLSIKIVTECSRIPSKRLIRTDQSPLKEADLPSIMDL